MALFERLMDEIDTAPVDEKLKPILHYVRKLTLTPSRMVQADADAVYAAGWTSGRCTTRSPFAPPLIS